jgi:hypothetical protein
MQELCDDLANLLAHAEGVRLARLLQNVGMLGQNQVPSAGEEKPIEHVPTEPSSAGTPCPISIWQPREANGKTVFVRP